jgi:DNA-binding protein H-NS
MTQAYRAGYNDAMNNLSKAYKIKDYELGYADGLVDRKNNNPNKAHSRQAAESNRPAYYDAEGGSMWNGIGRDYF